VSASSAAVADFGAVAAGAVIEKGDGLARDFCVLARIAPGRPPELIFCDDEDELEELEPDYLARVPHALCRELLEAAFAGKPVDPLQLVFQRRIRLEGDLQRIVRAAGRHQGAGLGALRAVPTRF
jgi:hypothetical protein